MVILGSLGGRTLLGQVHTLLHFGHEMAVFGFEVLEPPHEVLFQPDPVFPVVVFELGPLVLEGQVHSFVLLVGHLPLAGFGFLSSMVEFSSYFVERLIQLGLSASGPFLCLGRQLGHSDRVVVLVHFDVMHVLDVVLNIVLHKHALDRRGVFFCPQTHGVSDAHLLHSVGIGDGFGLWLRMVGYEVHGWTP
ncbi:MAG: hypothetical protein Aurels2KO_57560 [Aureliella sp.]